MKYRPDDGVAACARKHLRCGWWALLFFLTLGILLEALHGFKVGAYLNVSNSTRRLMWTLAHAHGALLALINIAFGLTVRALTEWPANRRSVASACLVGASVLLPGGFFVGGIVIYGGDPGLGILLVPLGALLLFIAVFQTARATNGIKSTDVTEAASARKSGADKH
ncbi:MAG: hypothetical protein HY043_08515 [Verrucomicrobia bacterium]|nr:hypothetical protein [Verrucomicrobiota bacterium]